MKLRRIRLFPAKKNFRKIPRQERKLDFDLEFAMLKTSRDTFVHNENNGSEKWETTLADVSELNHKMCSKVFTNGFVSFHASKKTRRTNTCLMRCIFNCSTRSTSRFVQAARSGLSVHSL